MKWMLIGLLVLPIVFAKMVPYPMVFGYEPVKERLLESHLRPGETIISGSRFMQEPINMGKSRVRWTDYGSYAIHLDKVHLVRKTFTLKIKSKTWWRIEELSFDTTKIYLPPDYYSIEFDKNTYIVWLSKYPKTKYKVRIN